MQFSGLARAAIITLAFTTVSFAQEKNSSSHDTHRAHPGRSAHTGLEAMEASPDAAKAPFDLQFIDTMIVHHESAIDMARLVEKRAAHDELRQMAKKIIDDQQNEIARMQGWKRQWFKGKATSSAQGNTKAVNMKMPGMAESMKDMSLDKLESSSGKAFDALFIDMMTRHHEGAVKMARVALKKGQHRDLKELAQGIAEAQQAEIEQMAAWKKEWQLDRQ